MYAEERKLQEYNEKLEALLGRFRGEDRGFPAGSQVSWKRGIWQ